MNDTVSTKELVEELKKREGVRIEYAEPYQDKKIWQMDYRRFHDLWVLENKLDSVFLNIKEAE